MKRSLRAIALYTSLLSLTIPSVYAQSGSLKLLHQTFEIEEDQDRKLTLSDIESWPTFADQRFGIISVENYPSIVEQAQLEVSGIRVLDYVPTGFYVVSLMNGADLSALDAYGVLSSTPFKDEFKGSVSYEDAPSWTRIDNSTAAFNVMPFETIELEALEGVLASEGVEIIEQHPIYHVLTVQANTKQLTALYSHPAIQHIDWKYQEGQPENYTGRTSHRVNYISPQNSNGIDYTGEGINVALQDDGAIGPHIDHHGRTVHFWPTSEGNHGDHVGGTIAGAGNLNPLHAGQAPGANLFVYKAFPEYTAYDSIPSHYPNLDLVITSTSYSDGCNAGYTSRARTMDDQSYDYESLIHVFSAGNSNGSNCGYGAGNSWGNITGGHKMGKNVITVANLSDVDVIAGSSSRGPAYDGRIKPDISAKGTSVISTIAGNEYDNYSGTSMSCPGVSGTMAVLYEAFEDVNNAMPDGGLMKAIALNTAEDVGNQGPDFIHGWGRINARRAYEVISNANYTSGTLAQSQGAQIALNVPSNSARARFMVYWTDPAAVVNAATSLVNDIDMRVVDPNGDTLDPYVLDHAPNPSTLNLPAQPGSDHLNNMEQVEVMNPASGGYTVLLDGFNIPMGPQEYFVVYWFEPETTLLTYPVGGESLTPFVQELIRWDAGDTSEDIDIEFSPDGGNTWSAIGLGVSPEQGVINWTPPMLTSAEVHIRLTQGATQIVSEPFSVMPTPTNLNVAWACPDSIGLVWTSVTNATSYDAFKLGTAYMDSIGSTNTTEFVDYGVSPGNPNIWYSVRSVGADGATSRRAIAINKPTGVFNCFLNFDVEAVSILPSAASLYSCHGEESRPGFIAKNNGVGPITSFDASFYKDQTGILFTETFSTNIAPGDQDTFYFNDSLSLDGQGLYEHGVVLDLGTDQNHWNDTVSQLYQVIQSPAQDPIWEEDFDDNPLCSTLADCSETDCDIEDGWTNEPNGLSDDIDWRVHQGATPTNLSGPNGDFTNNGFGRYAYLEASGDCTFQTASLMSPCVDLSDAEDATLSFYYHMFGSDMGELHVDVFDGESWIFDVTPVLSGNQGNSWIERTVDLSAFSGEIINVRFRGITGASFNSDMAIDGISMYHPPIANFDHVVDPLSLTVSFEDKSKYADQMTFDLGDGNVLVNVPASHVYDSASTYEITQIVSNDYGTDTFSVLINTLGVDNNSSQTRIALFPNPARNTTTLSMDHPELFSQLRVQSVDGRVVVEQPLDGRQSIVLNTDQWSAGVYLLRLSGEENVELKLIVQ